MKKPIKLVANAVTAKLMDAPDEAKAAVSSLLSYVVDGFEHTSAAKEYGWNGYSSFFSYRTNTFPAGFTTAVFNHLRTNGFTVQLLRKKAPPPLGEDRPKIDEFGWSERYDYQYETVDRLIRHRQMIAQVATGGGKSRIARLATARIGRPTLFITTRSVLMHQMKRGYEESGFKVGVMGDGTFAPIRGVNVGMVQTIQARLQEPNYEVDTEEEIARKTASRQKMIRILEMFELVILEEAHEAGGNGYFEIMSLMKNAIYRLALTATPFMRQDGESNMRLQAVSGPIGIRISEKLLIDRGILARPFFKYITSEMPKIVRRSTSWQRAYKYGIVENDWRNRAIVHEVKEAIGYGLTAMVLVQHQAHGKLLKKLFIEAGIPCDFIFGDSDQLKRETCLARLASRKIEVLIGSTILDVGVDVPAVGMVVLAGGGKAEVALRQRVGRGLRAKAFGPNVCFIVDFNDTVNKHLKAHSQQRRAIVESTPGFAENILPDDTPFDFNGLGFSAKKSK